MGYARLGAKEKANIGRRQRRTPGVHLHRRPLNGRVAIGRRARIGLLCSHFHPMFSHRLQLWLLFPLPVVHVSRVKTMHCIILE